MPSGSRRISHIVQAVEKRDEVEIASRVAHRVANLEMCVPDIGLTRALSRHVDGRGVVVVADEFRVGKGLSHQDRAGAVTASDVNATAAACELFHNPIERRQPGT